MNAYIEKDGRKRTVKNLGWLLRNWKQVESFVITSRTERPLRINVDPSCHMEAKLRAGVSYHTDWGSRDVLATWIVRPVFVGVKVNWFGKDLVVKKGFQMATFKGRVSVLIEGLGDGDTAMRLFATPEQRDRASGKLDDEYVVGKFDCEFTFQEDGNLLLHETKSKIR
jgi:hypothetical protein